MADLRAFFRCFSGCTGEWPLSLLSTRCPTCHGLLDVVHDLGPLRERSGASWRNLFDARRLDPTWPMPSGVWSKREWVHPDLCDEDIVSLGEGFTPLVPMPSLGAALGVADLWIKQCGHNPTGSFKDLGMTGLVSQVQRLRRLGHRIPAVACASTGDTSAALAAYCARAGLPSLVFLPAGKLSDEQLTQPLCSHSLTVAIDADFDRCMELVAAFCAAHGVYLANSMNPLRIEGQKTLSVEIVQQLGWQVPDWVVVPGGNLGHVTAIARGFAMAKTLGLIDREPRLLVAQAEQASPLYHAFCNRWQFVREVAGPTQATAIAIGNPVNVHKAIAELQRVDGAVEAASEDEITTAWTLGDRHGLQTDPHTGVALAALAKQVEKGRILSSQRVVVVSTAHGLKFGTLKRDFHLGEAAAQTAGPTSQPTANKQARRNPPLRLPPHLPTLDDVVLRKLDDAERAR
ncbi:MAG TPA: threonine synthase [Pseudomonadota bacterium]|nr:threonine synthase [Pseudomonadota bacterium]